MVPIWSIYSIAESTETVKEAHTTVHPHLVPLLPKKNSCSIEVTNIEWQRIKNNSADKARPSYMKVQRIYVCTITDAQLKFEAFSISAPSGGLFIRVQ
jgi:hypothetical protein